MFREAPDDILTVVEVCDLLQGKWSRVHVREQIRVLSGVGEIRCVGVGGPNGRAKVYQAA